MKRISLFLILILSSCSSSTKKQIVKPSFKNFEAIKLGASASSMENELGPPTAITKNEKFGANDFWV